MEAELRAVCLGLVAVVNDPVEQSGVGVVLEQHLNRLPSKDLNLEVREHSNNDIHLHVFATRIDNSHKVHEQPKQYMYIRMSTFMYIQDSMVYNILTLLSPLLSMFSSQR